MKTEKVEKLVWNLHDNEQYVIQIRSLRQELSHGLVLEKVHRVIKSNQKTWLKPYIDMNADLKNKYKFFELMNNAAFGKTMV